MGGGVRPGWAVTHVGEREGTSCAGGQHVYFVEGFVGGYFRLKQSANVLIGRWGGDFRSPRADRKHLLPSIMVI